jgi:hypothetical protein
MLNSLACSVRTVSLFRTSFLMFLCMLLLGCKPRATARAVERASLGRGRTLERTYPYERLDWHLIVTSTSAMLADFRHTASPRRSRCAP